MKKLGLILLLSLLLTSCSGVKAIAPWWSNDDKNETIAVPYAEKVLSNEEKQRLYPAEFSSLVIDVPVRVKISKGGEEQVVINAKEEVQQLFSIQKTGDALEISLKNDQVEFNPKKVEIVVYAQDFDKLRGGPGSRIKLEEGLDLAKLDVFIEGNSFLFGIFKVENLNLETRDAAQLKGRLKTKRLEMIASSKALIKVWGQTQQALISSTSKANIDAKNLNAEVATLHASDKGLISLAVSNEVDAVTDSNGDILIFKNGNPSIRLSESQEGSIGVR